MEHVGAQRQSRYLLVSVIVLAVLAVASFLIDVQLSRKNNGMQRELDFKYYDLEATPGTLVPPIRGFDVRDNSVSRDMAGDKGTVLMVLSMSCGYCEENWKQWQKLLADMDRNRVAPLFVVLSGKMDSSYQSIHMISGLQVIQKLDPANLVPYKFRLVPQTILIGKDGRVKKVWTGVLQTKDEREIVKMSAHV